MERRIYKKNMSSIDRLSELPDDVLVYILSLLSTKLSVSTSVLAKRWRLLWAHVPNLGFKGDDFKTETQHLDTIHRVMMLHQAQIVNTFSLSDVSCVERQLETLTRCAIQRGVQNFYVEFNFTDEVYESKDVFIFPRRLLACKTLVDLRLDYCGGIPSSGEVFLPSLKTLHLRFAEYDDDESLPHLISGCPVLEELRIKGCYNEEQTDLGSIVISSPTLKILNADLLYGCHMLTINTPVLRYLIVETCSLENLTSLRTMTSLIQAKISLNGNRYLDYDIDYTEHTRVVDFLNCLCHVKCLQISSGFEEKLVDIVGVRPMVKFNNLTRLEIRLSVDWHNLVKFLDVADNLEVLIINSGLDHVAYMEPKRVPTCMLSSLRNVTIAYWFENGFDIVGYVLRNAKVLEMMEIDQSFRIDRSDHTDQQKHDAFRIISLLERGSKSCQLAYY